MTSVICNSFGIFMTFFNIIIYLSIIIWFFINKVFFPLPSQNILSIVFLTVLVIL